MRYPLLTVCLLSSALAASCGGSKSPTAPSTTPPAQTQTRVIELGGALQFGAIQVGQSFIATFDIHNRGNAPLTVSGLQITAGLNTVYLSSFTSGVVQPGVTQTVAVRFTPLDDVPYNGTITVVGDQTSGTNTIQVNGSGTLAGLAIFTRSGTGNTVFDMPTYINRVRIQGSYSGNCQNFAVEIGRRLLVNEILGRCSTASGRTYDGTHTTIGGVVEITLATGVSWTISEIR